MDSVVKNRLFTKPSISKSYYNITENFAITIKSFYSGIKVFYGLKEQEMGTAGGELSDLVSGVFPGNKINAVFKYAYSCCQV